MATEDELIVYGPNLDQIARHQLVPRMMTGQRSLHKAHLPGEDLGKKHAILRERFAELEPSASRFLDGLVTEHRCGKDQAHKVLALLGMYRREDLVTALERAVRFRAFSLKAVERILAVQAQPKTPLASLEDQERRHLQPLLDDEPVPPRPTTEYQDLIGQESSEDDHPPWTEAGQDESTAAS